jgi:hypothetical protein
MNDFTEHSDDDAAQICLMATLLPTEAALAGEGAALLALHRLRFPAGDVARLGRAAIIRAASQRRALIGLVPAVLATPAAAHAGELPALLAAPAGALAAGTAPLDHDAAWITVAVVLGGACLCLVAAFLAQAFAVRADILRQKSRWDFEDGEEVVTPPKAWPGGGWIATEERERP